MDLVVETRSGSVKGCATTGCTDEKYYSFQGIPYARPPVGNLRFKDPIPVDPWTGVFQCKASKPCPQQETLSKRCVGNEDCLTLNVYTKEIKPTAGLFPVMVYIYGGGFMRGNSTPDLYGPDYLVDRDVVVVTFNYRVGAFGFLSLSDPELGIPGNAGMKDQVQALRWVQENIENFGGDPHNVTLFGESAGASSVHMHMLSPLSEGLFHKAIAMSGSAYNYRSISDPRRSLLLAKCFGWKEELGQKIALKVLQEAPPERLVEEQETLLTPEERRVYVLFPFGPVVEPYESEQCFLPASPLALAEGGKKGWGWGLNLPFITGVTSHEALLLYRETKRNPSILSNLGNFVCLLPQEFGLDEQDPLAVQSGADIKRHYFGDSEPSLENLDTYIKLLSDKLFVHGALRTARLHKGPVYFYRFAVDARNNLFKSIMCGNVPGACHADDIQYLFKPRHARCFHPGTVERDISEMLAATWSSFARDGVPTGREMLVNHWMPFTQMEAYLDIENDQVTIRIDLERDSMELWDGLYKRHKIKA